MLAGSNGEFYMRRILLMEKTQSTIILVLLGMLIFSGCDLTTNNHGSNGGQLVGKDLVINEVYAIPPSEYYAFSWIELMNASNRRIQWSSVATPAVGYACGSGGTILTTKDGGNTWLTVGSPTSSDLHAIRFREQDSGYIVGASGTILRSTNKGASWVQQSSGVTVNLNSIVTTLPTTGGKNAWVCGDSGTILITFNNGASWAPPLAGSGTTHSLHSIDMFSEAGVGNLYASGDAGTIIFSNSAGFSWNLTNANPNYSYYAVACYQDTAWAAGTSGAAFVTRDEGNDYAIESTMVSVNLRCLFVSKPALDPVPTFMPGEMWAAGDGGVIIRTTNSGLNWVKIDAGNIPTTNRLNSIMFVDSLRGWAFGDNGTIINTINAGLNWSLQNSGTTANLYSAYFYPIASLQTVYDQYVLVMYAQRKHVFFDPCAVITSGVNPNFDFITRVDTGYVFYNPYQSFGVGQDTIGPINPGGFVVINSDSSKFQDHFNLGPGSTQVANVSTGSYSDATGSGFVLWTLLPRGEIRLLKVFESDRYVYGNRSITVLTDTTLSYVQDIDVVRFGNFQADDKQLQDLARVFFVPGVPALISNCNSFFTEYKGTYQGADYYSYKAPKYANNIAAGYIPEWWSLARYGNDLIVDPTTEISAQSFYLTNVPIPGWYSQKTR